MLDDDFKPTYEVIPDTKKRNNKKIVAELKAAAKIADNIYSRLTRIERAKRFVSTWQKRLCRSVPRKPLSG